jgi:APA family basic amino acid/polyamine antiporter
MSFTMNAFVMGLFGVSLANYLKVLLPNLPVQWVAVAFITIFFVCNLFGVKLMAKLQNIMFVGLIVGLLLYIVTGLLHLRPDTLDLSQAGYFMNGSAGLVSAVMIFVFSTTGHYFVMAFSKEANNAKRDVPLAMILTTGIILLLYVGVAFVTANVLPIEEVMGQPLTVVADKTMPRILFYLFVFGGPVLALTTTINSNFTIFSRPLEQATKDGWFPPSVARHNRAGVPYKLIIALYIIGILPLIFGFSVREIVAYNILVDSISELFAYFAVLRFPDKIEGAWENRHFKFSKGFFYFIMGLSIIARIALIVISFNEVTLPIGIATIVLFAAFFIYARLRMKLGKVHMEKSYELQ